MTNQELFDKYSEIMKDEAVVEEFGKIQNIEEARAFFRDRGLNASDEELDGVLKAMEEFSKNPDLNVDEIGDEDLEQVSGGGALSFLYKVAKNTWKVGTWIAGKLVYGNTSTAQKEIIAYWKKVLGIR